ncbi:MAG: hypothetical protein GXP42_09665 [Chloroflexi bacterium]|nr:hypothetical protein [Chloroflexota bacterium]
MADESLAALHLWGLMFQGWTRAELGQVDEGVAMMEEDASLWRGEDAVSGRKEAAANS